MAKDLDRNKLSRIMQTKEAAAKKLSSDENSTAKMKKGEETKENEVENQRLLRKSGN